jgi:hypothetical protein
MIPKDVSCTHDGAPVICTSFKEAKSSVVEKSSGGPVGSMAGTHGAGV